MYTVCTGCSGRPSVWMCYVIHKTHMEYTDEIGCEISEWSGPLGVGGGDV